MISKYTCLTFVLFSGVASSADRQFLFCAPPPPGVGSAGLCSLLEHLPSMED